MARGKKTGGGTRKGVPNKVTKEFRETVRQLLEDNAANVGVWLTAVADGGNGVKADPGRALDLLAKLAEFAAPKLSRSEISGPGGGPVEVATNIDPKKLSDGAIKELLGARRPETDAG